MNQDKRPAGRIDLIPAGLMYVGIIYILIFLHILQKQH